MFQHLRKKRAPVEVRSEPTKARDGEVDGVDKVDAVDGGGTQPPLKPSVKGGPLRLLGPLRPPSPFR
jgi:hypothetical protein